MKNYRLTANNLVRALRGSGLTAALATLIGLATTVSYAQISPVGPTWDCLVSGGGQKGIIFLNFADDGTFSGAELLVPKPVDDTDTSSGGDGRTGGSGRGDADGRDGESGRQPVAAIISTGTGGTNTVSAFTNLFGFGYVDGIWSFNPRGRIVGAYTRQTEFGLQSVSFRGDVLKGPPRRLVLVVNGIQTFSGIAQTNKNVPNFNGTVWDGFKYTDAPVPLPEVFTLTSTGDPGLLNIYSMDSISAPGYSYSGGRCLVSIQKRIGFALLEESGTNVALRATLGDFYKRGFVTGERPFVKTEGLLDPDQDIVFKAQLQTVP